MKVIATAGREKFILSGSGKGGEMNQDKQPEKPSRMVTICAWCDNSKELTRRSIAEGFDVTHSICPKHKASMLAELKQTTQKAK